MSRTILVVPCYNESLRLDLPSFEVCLAENPLLDLIFVDDGSRDDTLRVLRGFEAKDPQRIQILDYEPNRGKAEAVRRGMLAAFDCKPAFAGYWDADLATPLNEIPRFLQIFDARPECEIVIGSRVKLLGRSIERGAIRHYLGRVAATVASQVLGLPVYDTQCGAKIFRASPRMRSLFEPAFCAGWVFDVEILARLVVLSRETEQRSPEEVIYELPLNRWRDIAGSKLKNTDFLTAFVEMARIHRRYMRGIPR